VHDGVDFTSLYIGHDLTSRLVCTCKHGTDGVYHNTERYRFVVRLCLQHYSYSCAVLYWHFSVLLLFLCSCLSLNSNFRVNCLYVLCCVLLHLSCLFTQPVVLPDNFRQISQQRNISAGEMYWTICVEWAGDHFGLGFT